MLGPCVIILVLIGGPVPIYSLAFDSMASLKTLVIHEEFLVEKVNEYITKERQRLDRISG